MSAVAKIVWIAGLAAVVGLIFSTGVAPVEGAFEAAGFGVAGVCLLRGVAVGCAGLGWFVLFPPAVRPNALTCVLIRFLREGANALLPMTQVGGEVIGARALTLRGFPASLSAASLVVDVLVQAVTQFLFAALGVTMLASAARSSAVGGTVAAVVAVAAPALGGFYFVQRPAGLQLVKTVLARVARKRAWLSFGAIEALYSRLRSIYANRSGLIAAFAIYSAALSEQRQVVCAGRSTRRPKRRLCREGAPLGQRASSPLFVNLAGDEMALLIEMVVDLGMN